LLFASLLLADQLIEKRGVVTPPPPMPPDPRSCAGSTRWPSGWSARGHLEKETARA
jgi:hypothetical protein